MVSKMTKKFKLILTSFIGIIIITLVSLILVRILNDPNKLTVEENKWINNSLSTVLNVNVLNDLDVFGSSGSGVFYDFLNDLGKEYNLKINPVTYTTKDSSVSSGFISTTAPDDKFVKFYADNYVLIKKEYIYFNDLSALNNLKIGILKSDEDYLKSYLKDNQSLEFVT